ncbi:MAG: recombinase family protein [Candidatus Njordarchaeales archaeon]
MKAVAYIRISREDENIENQKIAIEEFSKSKGLEIVGYFIDEMISGAVPPRERSRYKMMLEFAGMNNIKAIVFYDISRLGRNLEETLYEIKKLLEEGYDIYFVYPEFLNELKDPMMKKMIISILAWFAELYRYDVIQRTKAGLKRAKAEGKIIGRPPFPFPEAYVKKLLKKGLSIAQIHRLLVQEGKICRKAKGKIKCMSYEAFRRKVKALK